MGSSISDMQTLSRMASANRARCADEIRHEKERPKPPLAHTWDFSAPPLRHFSAVDHGIDPIGPTPSPKEDAPCEF
jgi:hypothetical protein